MNKSEMIRIIFLIFLCKYKKTIEYDKDSITIFFKDGTKIKINISKEKE